MAVPLLDPTGGPDAMVHAQNNRVLRELDLDQAVTTADTPAANEVLVYESGVWVAGKLDMDNLSGGAAATDEVLVATSASAIDWAKVYSANFRQNAWADYTPTLTAVTTNPTLGSGSTAAGRWTRQADRLIVAHVRIVFGTSGAAAGSGIYAVSLPVNRAAQTAVIIEGSGWIYDSGSTAFYLVSAFRHDTDDSTCRLVAETAGVVTEASPFTWAASDEINLLLTYEAVS